MDKLLICLALSFSICAQILLLFNNHRILYKISISNLVEFRIRKFIGKQARDQKRIKIIQERPITKKSIEKIQKYQTKIDERTNEIIKLYKYSEEEFNDLHN